MRVAILGNSGSGKSTLARWLSTQAHAVVLDLDTVAWEPGQVAVARAPQPAAAAVREFCAAHDSWVVEGCYATLLAEALEFGPRLVFLNPGENQCVENCRNRPWEPHKYESRQLQDSYLEPLLSWVSDYYRRDGQMSLSAHERCYRAYAGPKELVAAPLVLDPPSQAILAWAR